MQIKLITVAFDPEIGGFPTDPLSEVEGEVISIAEHFFHQNGLPHLLLVVYYRPVRDAKTSAPQRGADPGIRAQLAEHERDLYDRLRAWRNGLAQADGVAPYVLLTNRQLADVARQRPASLDALRQIQGIGEAKSKRFGRDLLAVVAQTPPVASPLPTEAKEAALAP